MISSISASALRLSFVFYIFPASVYANVDPAWLASWNEAVASRPSHLTSSAQMINHDEPGTKMQIKGLIYNPDGKLAKGVIVHAYHRDSQGFDFGLNDEETTTWRIQGWAMTDQHGRFTFNTIKPAPDHLGREGGHIHFTTISQKYGRQWAPKVYFSDDKLLTEHQKSLSSKAGKYGAIREVLTTQTGVTIDVSIKLRAEPDF